MYVIKYGTNLWPLVINGGVLQISYQMCFM